MKSDTRLIRNQASLWFGGDYNPEQWPEHVWSSDLAAFEELGVNAVTLPVFAWAKLHPAQDQYEFGWLDRILDKLNRHNIDVIMATPTAAQPAWMSQAYPEILPTDADGRRRRHGGRVNYCPTSAPYREASAEIASVMAERYADYPGLRLWHINNEYGPICFCDGCLTAFRQWAQHKYRDLDAINTAWAGAVWGNTLHDWSEIEFPSNLNAMEPSWPGRVRFSPSPSIHLDHARFASAVLLDCYRNEKDAISEHTPTVPITTNFHGPIQAVDWHEWAPHLDLVTWDSYPTATSHWSEAAFGHDMARTASRGRGFLLMESAPGNVSWQPMSSLKRPGVTRAQSLQAVAHGSRGALFFQIRHARGGNELNHAALIPRHGRLDTRMGRELIDLGAALAKIGLVAETHRVRTKVALVFSWPAWWAHHATPGFDQRSRYIDTVRSFHEVLSKSGIAVDVVGTDGPWDGYDTVVAPLLYLVEPTTAAALADFVAAGGTLVTTTGSAIVGGDGRVHDGGIESTWSRVLGLWVEETDVRPATVANPVKFLDDGTMTSATELFDLVRLDTAAPAAVYTKDFLTDHPAVTSNPHGRGTAIYLASPSPDLFAEVVSRFIETQSEWQVSGSVDCVEWTAPDSDIAFLINHGPKEARVNIPEGEWTDLLTDTDLHDTHLLAPTAVLVARRQT